MPGSKLRPVLTENFALNFDKIRSFLGAEGGKAFQKLLDRLTKEIVPTLCQYPRVGRDFLQRPRRSLESESLFRTLKGLLGADEEVREFIVDDYLVLYLLRKKEVAFLSIKHHRQLSYDLKRFWA